MNRSVPNPFPAVLIGGPPHSGKSVLTYSLTQLLRENWIDHYVLRACPDGEGDFSNEAHPETVKMIRQKGKFDPQFVERVCQGLQNRHFPLLVDVGGKPTPDQEVIFTHCTHAILIADELEKLTEWRARIERINATTACNIEIIAELHSQLTQPDQLGTVDPLFGAVIGGLKRGQRVKGVVCDALLQRLTQLFLPSVPLQRQAHLAAAPCKPDREVDRIGQRTGQGDDATRWQIEELPQFLDSLPTHSEIALYGRGPVWLYCAAAIHTQPAPFHSFDARLGWVKPISIELRATPIVTTGTWQTAETDDYVTVHWQLGEHYLDYEKLLRSEAPWVDAQQGVVISCRGPIWFQSALAIAYAKHNPWVAMYYPPTEQAVVVYSRTPAKNVGDAFPYSLPPKLTLRIKNA